LEAIHLGTQGFSPRTRSDSEVIRFGERAARIQLSGRRQESRLEVRLDLAAGQGKRAWLNGAPLRAAEQLRGEIATLVFTPDRLAVVKGGPAVRRAYFDRVASRLAPARATVPADYAAAVAQRNAALRRVAAGFSTRDALEPWTGRVADLGTALVGLRHETVELLGSGFSAAAAEFGLPDAALGYDAEPPTRAGLEARLDRDLERATTGLGPHLDDVVIASGVRELRSFGSQGEQRLAVLALLLAEADLIADRRGFAPLLLLDDVLSELDAGRRDVLATRLERLGQTLVSATDAGFLPRQPAQLIEVRAGEVIRS
jgi:DNA replication and repair protein RecF